MVVETIMNNKPSSNAKPLRRQKRSARRSVGFTRKWRGRFHIRPSDGKDELLDALKKQCDAFMGEANDESAPSQMN